MGSRAFRSVGSLCGMWPDGLRGPRRRGARLPEDLSEGEVSAVVTYDPTDPDVLTDPFPHYRSLRDADTPAVYLQSVGHYAIGRYDEAVEVLRNPGVFGSEGGYGPAFDWTYGKHPENTAPGHPLYRP